MRIYASHHKRFGLKTDIADFVRGAMLHDFYLYYLHGEAAAHKLHWFKHHMYPLTPVPPTTKSGWLICFYDKIAAIGDRFGENKWEKKRLYFEKREKEAVYNNL